MIYFDNSATTQIDPEVFDAMKPYLEEEYGNPSSKYYDRAECAKKAVERAREQVAELINAKPEEIVFTAGATESTNFIIKGYLDYRKYYGDGKNHVITTMTEHKATINTCKFLNGDIYSNNDPSINLFGEKKTVNRGFEASFVPVDQFGVVDMEALKNTLKENSALVSAIYVNNEVGSVNDISEIAQLAHSHGALLHTDVTQALGKRLVDVRNLECDYLSCSAHKIHGPKGVGAAFLKSDVYGVEPITAFLHGGEQEQGLRAGTLAVHDIVGFGKAAEIAKNNFEKNEQYIADIDKYLVENLLRIPHIRLTNPSVNRQSGIVSIIIDRKDFNNERFLKKISSELALSTGSSCSLGEPSYVLKAMGLSQYTAKVLRISLNKYTKIDEIDKLLQILSRI